MGKGDKLLESAAVTGCEGAHICLVRHVKLKTELINMHVNIVTNDYV